MRPRSPALPCHQQNEILYGLPMKGFFEIAAADPERPAVSGLTYGELLGRVNQASNGLLSRGCVPGDTVVTVLPNGADAITMMLATYQIGDLPGPGQLALHGRGDRLHPRRLLGQGRRHLRGVRARRT